MTRKARQIIVKVTGDYCNLRCDYCFYNDHSQSKKTVMDIATLARFMEQYFEHDYSKYVQFIWHGGEPLLAGLEFFEKAMNLQKMYQDVSFANIIQTNATVINDKWVRFFKKYDFGIGISLDGCKESHDSHRKFSNGRGTFERVESKIKLCHAHGLKTGIIQTISKDNIGNLYKDWNYIYSELGQKSWGINIYNDCSTPNNQDELTIDNSELKRIYREMITFWSNQDDECISIREIDDLILAGLGKMPKGCSFNGTCGKSYFCLNYDGNIYLCDRTSNDTKNSWGNINVAHIDEILGHKNLSEHTGFIQAKPDDCQCCKWLKYCNNGCSALRDKNNKYIFCDTRKVYFDYFSKQVMKS